MAICCLSSALQAQFIARTSLHGGYVMAHRKEMQRLITGHSAAVTIAGEWWSKKDKEWHKVYLYPSIGGELSWIGLGNEKELGRALCGNLTIRLPFNASLRRSHGLRMGIGAAFLTRRFELRENNHNTAIGSRFNACIVLEYDARFRLSEQLWLSAGLRITHFSNGAYSIPNLGLNIPGIYAGVAWSSSEIPQGEPGHTLPQRPSSHTTVFASMGLKEKFPAFGPKYGTFTLSAAHSKRLSDRSSVLGGGDLFYNNATRARQTEIDSSRQSFGDVAKLGLALGYCLHLGEMDVIAQMGYYIHDRGRLNGDFYHRFGLRRPIYGKLIGIFHLKTHFAKADHFEAGIGWRW